MDRFACRSITLDPDGSIALEYTEPAKDFRTNGLVQNHVIFVPAKSDYDNELEDVRVAVQALLADVTQDLGLVPAVEIKEEDQ